PYSSKPTSRRSHCMPCHSNTNSTSLRMRIFCATPRLPSRRGTELPSTAIKGRIPSFGAHSSTSSRHEHSIKSSSFYNKWFAMDNNSQHYYEENHQQYYEEDDEETDNFHNYAVPQQPNKRQMPPARPASL